MLLRPRWATPRGSRRGRLALAVWRAARWAAVVAALCLGGLLLYVYSFHRIQSLSDAAEVFRALSLPLVDDRCRRANDTHLLCLPNVFFIGASKCGTTSVTEYLSRHPRVHFVRRRIHRTDRHREVHRFDRNTYPRAFRSLEIADEWASSPLVRSANDAVIHYTPHYLYAPSVPFDLRRFFGGLDGSGEDQGEARARSLRFVVFLRDPTRRALSSYWFQNSHIFHAGGDGGSNAELAALCSAEMAERKAYDGCMTQAQAQLLPHGRNQSSPLAPAQARLLEAALSRCFGPLLHSARLGGRHVDKGVYADQLERWFANFPRRQFFITSLEQWQTDAPAEFGRLLRFLGVEGEGKSEGEGEARGQGGGQAFSASSLGSSGPLARLVRPNSRQQEPPPELRAALDAYYAPHLARLRSLLGAATPSFALPPPPPKPQSPPPA